jgi:hypothetical protein
LLDIGILGLGLFSTDDTLLLELAVIISALSLELSELLALGVKSVFVVGITSGEIDTELIDLLSDSLTI